MIEADYLMMLGMVIGAWAAGFGAGLFWRAVKRVIEKAIGVGTL